MNKTDWGKINELLEIRLVNVERNKDMLEEVPHRTIGDIAIVYQLLLSAPGEKTFAVTINYGVMNALEVTEEELYEAAMDNTMRLEPPVFEKLTDLLRECAGDDEISLCILDSIGDDDNLGLYALTNRSRTCGAAAMMYPRALQIIGNMMNDDIVILPSSIHEVLVFPSYNGIDFKPLEAMVREINREVVDGKDLLSDHVFLYHRDTDTIEMVETGLEEVA